MTKILVSLLVSCGVAVAGGQPSEETKQAYPDGRPVATLRMEAVDQGVVMKHGDGPGWTCRLKHQQKNRKIDRHIGLFAVEYVVWLE